MSTGTGTGTPIVVIPSNLSYVAVESVEAYVRYHLGRMAWITTTLENQQAALVTATKVIDRLPYIGYRAVEGQVLKFPRIIDGLDDGTTVPQSIQEACIEIAIALLNGVDPEMEFNSLTLTRKEYAGLVQVKDARLMEPHKLVGVPSLTGYLLLVPYLREVGTISLNRIS